ncbi:hypothetical protein AB833_01975 [Chromatiales bacterium (ex Bugula neritina AB1)]|nr:hypothetical protein AB833_01975 [Chromatiales bacterium (ex Bugula neritina AB1)]
MRKIRVLVVDDEIYMGENPRLEVYEKLKNKLVQFYDNGLEFEVTFSDNEIDVLQELQANIFDIAIVDLVLTGSSASKFSEEGVDDIFEKIYQRSAKTFLVTKRFDNAQIRTILKAANQEGFYGLYPFNFIENGSNDFANLLAKCVIDSNNSTVRDFVHRKIEENKELRMLFVSDLHVGEEELDSDELELANLYNKMEPHLGGERRPDLICILGDFIDKGNPKSVNKAVTYVNMLSGTFCMPDLPNPYISCLPGNHDVITPLAISAYLQRENGTWGLSNNVVNNDLLESGLMYFNRDITSKIYEIDKYLGKDAVVAHDVSWIDGRFIDLGICLVGLNTNLAPNLESQVVGDISVELVRSLQAALVSLPTELKRNSILFVLTHHHTYNHTNRNFQDLHTVAHICGFKAVVFVSGDEHLDSTVRPTASPTNSVDKLGLEVKVATMRQSNSNRTENATRGMLLLEIKADKDNYFISTHRFKVGSGSEITHENIGRFSVDNNGWYRTPEGNLDG